MPRDDAVPGPAARLPAPRIRPRTPATTTATDADRRPDRRPRHRRTGACRRPTTSPAWRGGSGTPARARCAGPRACSAWPGSTASTAPRPSRTGRPCSTPPTSGSPRPTRPPRWPTAPRTGTSSASARPRASCATSSPGPGPLRDADGRIVGLRGATLDVSRARGRPARAGGQREPLPRHLRPRPARHGHDLAAGRARRPAAARQRRLRPARWAASRAAELDGMGLSDWTPPTERRRSRARLRDMAAGRSRGSSYARRYLRADGSIVHAWVTTAVVDDDDGRPEFAIAHCIDDTERRRHLQRARAAGPHRHPDRPGEPRRGRPRARRRTGRAARRRPAPARPRPVQARQRQPGPRRRRRAAGAGRRAAARDGARRAHGGPPRRRRVRRRRPPGRAAAPRGAGHRGRRRGP